MALSAGQAFIFGGLTLITLMNLVLVLLIGQIFIKLGHSLEHWNVLFFRTFTNTRSTERNTTQEQVVKWVADTMHLMTNQKTQDRALLRVIWAIPRKPLSLIIIMIILIINCCLICYIYLLPCFIYFFLVCLLTEWTSRLTNSSLPVAVYIPIEILELSCNFFCFVFIFSVYWYWCCRGHHLNCRCSCDRILCYEEQKVSQDRVVHLISDCFVLWVIILREFKQTHQQQHRYGKPLL